MVLYAEEKAKINKMRTAFLQSVYSMGIQADKPLTQNVGKIDINATIFLLAQPFRIMSCTVKTVISFVQFIISICCGGGCTIEQISDLLLV